MGAIDDDPTIYDNFNVSAFDGVFDVNKWVYVIQDQGGSTTQQDGVLVLSQGGINKYQSLKAIKNQPIKLNNSMAFEANLKAEMTSDVIVRFEVMGENNNPSAICGLHSMSDIVMAHCWTRTQDPAIGVPHRTWHTVRIEINLDTNTITFYIDGNQLVDDHYKNSLRGTSVNLFVEVWAATSRTNNTRPMVGYVDNIRVYPLEYVNP